MYRQNRKSGSWEYFHSLIGGAGHAIGHRHHRHVLVPPRGNGLHPTAALVCLLADHTARAPCISKPRTYASPRLLIPNNCARPPVECWRGTSPNQAANSRPLRNVCTSPTAATNAIAVPPRHPPGHSCLTSHTASQTAAPSASPRDRTVVIPAPSDAHDHRPPTPPNTPAAASSAF